MDNQTKQQSLIEATISTLVGFGISYFAWILIIAPLFDLPISHATNFAITCIFTVISLARGYLVRRMFASGTWSKAVTWTLARFAHG